MCQRGTRTTNFVCGCCRSNFLLRRPLGIHNVVQQGSMNWPQSKNITALRHIERRNRVGSRASRSWIKCQVVAYHISHREMECEIIRDGLNASALHRKAGHAVQRQPIPLFGIHQSPETWKPAVRPSVSMVWLTESSTCKPEDPLQPPDFIAWRLPPHN
jgi:hypothetical protein